MPHSSTLDLPAVMVALDERKSESGLGFGPMPDWVNTPTGLSCSGRVRLPSVCPPGLRAGICRSCRGWRGDRAPGAPGRSPRGPRRPSTPARRCSRTRTGRPHLQGLEGTYTKLDRAGVSDSVWANRRADDHFSFIHHVGHML